MNFKTPCCNTGFVVNMSNDRLYSYDKPTSIECNNCSCEWNLDGEQIFTCYDHSNK